MIEFEPATPEAKKWVDNEAEWNADQPALDIKPNMLCLMDTDYSSANMSPGQIATIKKGTPVIIRSINESTCTVIAEDFQNRQWTFKEEEDFEDVDYYFYPLSQKKAQILRSDNFPERVKFIQKHWELSMKPGAALMAAIAIIMFIFRSPLMPIINVGLFAVAAACLLYSIGWVICYRKANQAYVCTAMQAFAENYEQNLRELNTLIQRCPIYIHDSYESDDE